MRQWASLYDLCVELWDSEEEMYYGEMAAAVPSVVGTHQFMCQVGVPGNERRVRGYERKLERLVCDRSQATGQGVFQCDMRWLGSNFNSLQITLTVKTLNVKYLRSRSATVVLQVYMGNRYTGISRYCSEITTTFFNGNVEANCATTMSIRLRDGSWGV